MPIVTALEPEPRSGGVRLQVDHEPYATLAPSDVAELRLRIGADLESRTSALIARRAEIFGARVVAMKMLASRALPSFELQKRLVRRGHPREVAEAAVKGLVEAGLVDDTEFARHFARTRSRRRLGPLRLKRELQRFGIAKGEAEAAVREALEADGVDVAELLKEAASRKLRSLAGKDPAKARRSLRAFLLRQGFAAGDIAAFMRGLKVA